MPFLVVYRFGDAYPFMRVTVFFFFLSLFLPHNLVFACLSGFRSSLRVVYERVSISLHGFPLLICTAGTFRLEVDGVQIDLRRIINFTSS